MRPVAAGPMSTVRRTRRLAGLASVYDGDVEAVVWERQLAAAVTRDAEAVVRQPRRTLTTWRRGASWRLTGRPSLDDDLATLAEVLADLVECEEVGVRLEAPSAPMCPRWHVDRVEVRLVSTYVGPGPEIAATSDVARDRLRAGECLLPGATPLRTGTGEVVLLKGEAWEGNAGRGVVHRSPHCSGTRLVVTMDPLA